MKDIVGGTFTLMGDISVTKSDGKRPLWKPKRRWEYIVACTSVAREQLGKHIPTKTNSWPTRGKVFPLLGNEIVNTQQ
jgi:hypothetical protein